MHYFLYPTKDTFISNDPDYIVKNMGIDEILEVEKMRQPNACGTTTIGEVGNVISRALLQFDLTDISRSIVENDIPMPKFYLTMRVAQSIEVPLQYTLFAYPLATEWNNGTGYKYDSSVTADGASWRYADGVGRVWWAGQSEVNCDGGGVWYTGSGGSTASISISDDLAPHDPQAIVPVVVSPITGSLQCSQTFNHVTGDVRMDITTIVMAWISNTIPNNGLIIVHSGESDFVNYGKLRFFSRETNTIYSPHIDVVWNDTTYVTGSSEEISIRSAVVGIKNMSPTYRHGSVVQFIVNSRQRFAVKTFTTNLTGSALRSPWRLPLDSFYSIRDSESNEILIPFGSATRLSYTEEIGNYFTFDTTGLPQERPFKVVIQSEQSGSITTFDIQTKFKISR